MNSYESWEIAGHTLEYLDDVHQYIVDGVCVDSITQILKYRFKNKYEGVSRAVLKKASEKGTALHTSIEYYCKTGEILEESAELYNFIYLKNHYGFEVLENEQPVILSIDGIPVCAGRLDMVIQKEDHTGIADIKRTAKLDKDYLMYQLNLYRLAYKESYGKEIDFLGAIHLKDTIRKYVEIPINENVAIDLVDEYMKRKDER